MPAAPSLSPQLLTHSANRYCEVLERDPQQCYESLDINLIYNFFDWVLSQKVGKDGRRMRGVKKISALNTYWKYFLLAYNIAVGHKIDSRLADSMKNESVSSDLVYLTDPCRVSSS